MIIRVLVPFNFSNTFLSERHKSLKNRLSNAIKFRIAVTNFVLNTDALFLPKEKKLISSFEYLFNLLNDEYSKKLLLKVLAYRILGPTKVNLPLNNQKLFDHIEKIEKAVAQESVSVSTSRGEELHLHELSFLGNQIKLYLNSAAIYSRFFIKGYNFKRNEIKVEKGNVVIDAGACYGDTAIYFACHTGKSGKVYSFEFVKQNIDIFNKNIQLNKKIAPIISLVKMPLWSNSNTEIFVEDEGPGSKAVLEKSQGVSKHKTISIDDFVSKEEIDRVDFIKMDIEGAELHALKGATNVIKKFKPKLAICVYHKVLDCYEIPKFIESLNLGYTFYFDHYSTHNEESVIFAKV